MNNSNDSLQDIKLRRDGMLQFLVGQIPYLRFMGIEYQRMGDELTAIMRYDPKLIGNPILPALHGGGTAGFLEATAIIGLVWHQIWDVMEAGKLPLNELENSSIILPKTIDFTTDYLRPGLARDAYARAKINRAGRRYASVHIEAWQDNRERLFAQAAGHFLMPSSIFPIQGEAA